MVINGMNAAARNGIAGLKGEALISHLNRAGECIVKLTAVDLAKNLFEVHAMDEHGNVLVKNQLRPDQMATLLVKLSPCVIRMEACGSAHQWRLSPASKGAI